MLLGEIGSEGTQRPCIQQSPFLPTSHHTSHHTSPPSPDRRAAEFGEAVVEDFAPGASPRTSYGGVGHRPASPSINPNLRGSRTGGLAGSSMAAPSNGLLSQICSRCVGCVWGVRGCAGVGVGTRVFVWVWVRVRL